MEHPSLGKQSTRPDRTGVVSRRAIAWVDGRVVPASEATVPLTDDGFLRGDAVFEAVLVRSGRTHALDQHLARMRRSARTLDLRLPVLRQVVADLLAAWGDQDGALRLIATRGGTVRGLLESAHWPDSLALGVLRMPWRTTLSGAKTLSYAANQWAIRAARAQGADDALIVDDDVVHELPTGAVCVVRDGVVTSPDPERQPILDSVTVRELASIADVERTVMALDEVRAADELFVVSATRPILPVHALVDPEHEVVELPAPGPVTARLRDAFAAHIDATLDLVLQP